MFVWKKIIRLQLARFAIKKYNIREKIIIKKYSKIQEDEIRLRWAAYGF